MPPEPATVPPGMLACTTHGAITADTTASLVELMRFNERSGKRDVLWTFVSIALVDKARNEAAKQMLTTRYENGALYWLLFLDADMVFAPNVLDQLLHTAYTKTPWADVVGGWCPLRGEPFLPTTDIGSGTWESVEPGQGPIEVIRTGGACLLVKRHVFERLEWPFFGTRAAPRPLDMLAEVDNFARCKLDGTNPLRSTESWQALEKAAVEEAARQRATLPEGPMHLTSFVGEDSNFCDKVRAAGMRIVVDTDVTLGHVDKRVLTHEDHSASMKHMEQRQRWATGILT